jgi:hypothetical protein
VKPEGHDCYTIPVFDCVLDVFQDKKLGGSSSSSIYYDTLFIISCCLDGGKTVLVRLEKAVIGGTSR